MASRKPVRVRPARRSVNDNREGFLPNITGLIDSGGQISIGTIRPIACAAIANDEDQCLAMLQRRPGETIEQLLKRLDAAIDTAITTEEMIDEINPPVSTTRKASRRS